MEHSQMITEDTPSPSRTDAREGEANLNWVGVGPGHRVLRRRKFLESTIPAATERDTAAEFAEARSRWRKARRKAAESVARGRRGGGRSSDPDGFDDGPRAA
jgi:hypothetical protein